MASSRRVRIGTAALAIGGIAALAGGGAAMGEASKKNSANHDYQSDADSSAGLQLPGDLGVDLTDAVPADAIEIGSTSSESTTYQDDDSAEQKSGSSGRSSASALSVLGTSAPGTTAECDDATSPTDSSSFPSLDVGGVAEVSLLSASCDARAVKSNNASSRAHSDVATIDAAGASVQILASDSENKTTSGQSHSGSSFSVVSANLDDGETELELVVIQCTSSSFDNNGTEGSSSSFHVVSGAPEPVGDVAGPGACPLADSSSTYEKTE